jgi:hypothetical protein
MQSSPNHVYSLVQLCPDKAMRRRIDNYQRAWLELMFAGIGVMSQRLANVVVV